MFDFGVIRDRQADRRALVDGRLWVALSVSVGIHLLGLMLGVTDRWHVSRGKQTDRVLSVRLVNGGHPLEGVVVRAVAKKPRLPQAEVPRIAESRVESDPPSVQSGEPVGYAPLPEKDGAEIDGRPVFFPLETLSIRPQPITFLEGVGPPDVDQKDMHGRMVLKVWVDGVGNVANTEILYSDMPETLSGVGVGAFRKMRFLPGRLDGHPVGTVMIIEMRAEDFALPVE